MLNNKYYQVFMTQYENVSDVKATCMVFLVLIQLENIKMIAGSNN